tara:strand:+ start:68195 stop:68704 length:510 start_codon:yes stop_codon:yes gene_type:complete
MTVDVEASELVGDDFYDLRWELDRPAGSRTELSSIDGERTSFRPDESGLYEVRLLGTDGHVSGYNEVSYELTDDSLSLDIRGDLSTVRQGEEVTLIADGHDCKGGCLTYSWAFRSIVGPVPDVPFDNPEPNIMRFVATELGDLEIAVRLEDAEGNVTNRLRRLEVIEAN